MASYVCFHNNERQNEVPNPGCQRSLTQYNLGFFRSLLEHSSGFDSVYNQVKFGFLCFSSGEGFVILIS